MAAILSKTNGNQIGTKWQTFGYDFQRFGFGMVGIKAISIVMNDHSKTEPLEKLQNVWYSNVIGIPLVFKPLCICSIYQPL